MDFLAPSWYANYNILERGFNPMVSNQQLRRDVAKNDAKAMCFLAMRYFDGFTTRRNPERGLELVKKAKKLQSPYANYFLGYYEKHYAYSPKKDDKIKAYFRQANIDLAPLAEQKDAFACYCLGMINKRNTDDESKAKVLEYFSIAADDGMTEAQYELGLLYMNNPDKAKDALKLVYQAADKGYHKAQKAMGDFYSYGRYGLMASPEVSLEWYTKAAHNGNHIAMKVLGERYQGNGNAERARYWIKKSQRRKSVDE